MKKRLSKISKKIIISFDMTEEEWEKYNELHPNAERKNHNIVPDRKKHKNEMTDEQKKLDYIAGKGIYEIMMNVAKNPNTHEKTLEKLSDNKNPRIRFEVLKNKNVNEKILDKLNNDKYMTIRYYVANHPKTSNKTLRKMLKDKEYSVSSSAELNLNSRKNVNNNKSLIRKIIKKIRELY